MRPPADDHDCGWKTRATDLEAKLEATSAKLDVHATADRDHSDRTIMITGIGDVIT
jgi:hypothetical protein